MRDELYNPNMLGKCLVIANYGDLILKFVLTRKPLHNCSILCAHNLLNEAQYFIFKRPTWKITKHFISKFEMYVFVNDLILGRLITFD